MKTTSLRNMLAAIAALFIALFALPQQAQAEDYDLSIAGVQVTSANCADLTAIPGVSGTVKYVPATKTLYLENATITTTADEQPCIWNKIDGLTVRVKGTVNLTANSSALVVYRSATITGGGTLNATSDNCGIYVYETHLTIDGCTVHAKGEWGIAGRFGDSETLTIKNATVTAEGNGMEGSIIDLKALVLEGCAITTPAGAAFNASLKGVALGGQLVKEKIVIGQSVGTPYELKIAGVQVTSANAADLTVIPGVSGTVKYVPATKTLYLENATITTTADDQACIFSEIDGLTVRVKGTVNLTVNSSALTVHRSATITGGGTLNATSSKNCGIYVNETHLTIDGCTVNAKGEWGIAGLYGHSETLTIKNATVTAEGNGTRGSLCDLKALTLEGCKITQPAGAAFDASLRGVALGGQLVKEKIVIGQPVATPYALEIAGTQVTSANCADLSAIPGVTGTVKYDPATKTLTLDGATIAAPENWNAIGSWIDGLTIRVKGTVNLTAQTAAIGFAQPATITGGGTLNTTSSGDCGIYVYQTRLTIDGCTVHAKGKYGIKGWFGNSETLTIKNATVTAEGDGTRGSLCDLKALTLEGCAITQPAGAAFDASLKGVAQGGQIVKTKVEIAPVPNAIAAPEASEAGAKRQGTYTLRGVKLDAPLESLPAGVYIYNGKKVVKK